MPSSEVVSPPKNPTSFSVFSLRSPRLREKPTASLRGTHCLAQRRKDAKKISRDSNRRSEGSRFAHFPQVAVRPVDGEKSANSVKAGELVCRSWLRTLGIPNPRQ